MHAEAAMNKTTLNLFLMNPPDLAYSTYVDIYSSTKSPVMQ